ncbi:MAG: hypothetical protein JWO00_620 [Candidatus Parcubacteria bacterium]|nr:hypothetical protein [Candidatus Parcubacteria bacterium]
MKKEDLKRIIAKNDPNLHERAREEGWKIRYNKRSDMLLIGNKFPKGSFYTYVLDTGFMLRIDKNETIHGYAIENAKYFIRQNAEIGFVLYPFVYPIRAKILFAISRMLRNTSDLFKVFTVNNYVSTTLCRI